MTQEKGLYESVCVCVCVCGGGGGNSLQVHYEKWGGGGERCKLPHWGLGRSPRSFASRDPHHISGP